MLIHTHKKLLVTIVLIIFAGLLMNGCAPDIEKLADEENVSRLIKALKFRGDAEVRVQAAEALGKIGDDDAIEPLIERMSTDEEADVREAAAIALDNFDDDEIIQPLIERLTDESMAVQTAARIALLDYEDEAVEALIETFENGDAVQQEKVINVLVQMDEFAIQPLISALSNPDDNIRNGAQAALTALGETAMPDLILALDTNDEELQQQIITVLLNNKEESVLFLVEALSSEDEGIAEQAKAALVLMEETAVVPLTELLNDPNEQVVTLASEALTEIGESSMDIVIDALIDALADEGLQAPASTMLIDIGEPAIIPLINQLADEKLQAQASQVLVEMGEPAIEQILIAFEEDPELAENVIDPLVNALTVYDKYTREKAADALVAIGEPAVPALINALKEHHKIIFPDESVMYASEILYSPQDSVTGTLVSGGTCEEAGSWSGKIVLCVRGENYFSEKTENVEEAGGIGVVIYNNDADPLIATLGSDFEGTIPVVLVTHQEGETLLSDHLNDKVTLVNEEQYFNADDALIAMGITALPYLIESLPDDTTYTQVEAIILGMGTTPVPMLIDAIEDEEQYVRRRAITILRQIGDERAVEPILNAFDDRSPVVRSAAAYAMTVFTSPDALDPLIELLGDTDDNVITSAMDALDAYDVSAPNRLLELYADKSNVNRNAIEDALLSYYSAHSSEIVAAAKGVCNGTPIENATAYNRYEQGPHPTIILSSSSTYSYWNSNIPVEWRPYSPEQIQTVVCTDTYEKVVVQVCRYYYTSTGAAAPSKTRYRWKSTGGLYNAATGRLIGSFSLYGSLPDYCPYTSSSSSSTSITGGYVEYEDMEKWLKAMGLNWD